MNGVIDQKAERPGPFGLPLGHLQSLLTPDPLDTLVVHPPTLSPEKGCDPTIAVPPVFRGQLHDPFYEQGLIVRWARHVSLAGTRLLQNPARPPFAYR